MAEKLLRMHKTKLSGLELIPSGGGVFEIKIDDQPVFSKKELGRFPEEGEVEKKLEAIIK